MSTCGFSFDGTMNVSSALIDGSGLSTMAHSLVDISQTVPACRREAASSPASRWGVRSSNRRDIGDVVAKVLTTDAHDGKVYTLTGPKAITNARVAQQLTLAAGRAVTVLGGNVQTRQALIDRDATHCGRRNGRTPQQNCVPLWRRCFSRHRTATRPDDQR